MITSVHTLVYAHEADAARAFFRDVLGWPHVDAHDGWLIFRTGPSELGVHPTSDAPQHQISLMCDHLEQTMADLRAKGAEFASEVSESDFGRTVMMRVPGAQDMLLYQPHHPTAYDL